LAAQRRRGEDTLHNTFRHTLLFENAAPTFCRMTKAALKDQVGRNMLLYVDEIVMASKKKTTYISDLVETFANMREA
jgi:hypothetical protein